MDMKKALSSILKKASDSVISQNTVSALSTGIEDMPKSIKETR